MLTGSDVALARLSTIAYLDTPNGLPLGFTPITQAALGLSLGAQESYANGVYHNLNGAALLTVGTLGGQTTAVLAFRGSDDRQDSLNDLQNINREFQLFSSLIGAFDALVARQGITQVAITGHSLGGAMAQIYLANHPNLSYVSYVSDTFGSPGVIQAPGADSRITNVQVSDDPAVYLGLNRAAVGSQLQSNPALAAAAVFAGPEVFPGLTQLDVINSIGQLNVNYVNRGDIAYLPDANGGYSTVTSVTSAANAGKSEHIPTTYVARIEALTGTTGDDQRLPEITPTTIGTQVFRFFDAGNGTHFYTTDAAERDQTLAGRPDLAYEGVGLNGTSTALDAAATAVFRFFDTANGSHFYTASADERSGLATNARFTDEGISFYEDTAKQANNQAVYRFFDNVDGTHFFTASATEKAQVLATRPDLVNEGVAFYTLST